jgi:hypothetical protein
MDTHVTQTETAKKIAAARREFLGDLLATFESPCGKRVLAWLHASAATRSPSFIPGANGTDSHAAAARDGRKAIVWEIEANLDNARREHGATPATGKPKATGKRSTGRQGG